FQAEDGIRDFHVTGVQTCALPILTTTTIAITVNNVREQVVITPGPIIPFPAQPTVSVIPPGTIDVRHGTLSLTGVVVQREGDRQIGRASCRERGESAGVDGGGRKK